MPSRSSKCLFPEMKRAAQENSAYCGPAVIQMLASFLEVEVTQTEVVAAAGVEEVIAMHGMKLSDLATACQELMPQFTFWYKRKATMSELSKLVNQAKYPVGVEWQGTFETESEDEEFEDEDDDAGHFSVVTGISLNENWITLADPYFNKGVDKQFTILTFERRWWDINTVIESKTGKKREMDDYQALFLLTQKGRQLPIEGLLGGG